MSSFASKAEDTKLAAAYALGKKFVIFHCVCTQRALRVLMCVV